MALSSGRGQKYPPTAYLVISRRASLAGSTSIETCIPRHRRRVVGAHVLKYPALDTPLAEGEGWVRHVVPAKTGSWHDICLRHRRPIWEEHTMTDKTKTQDWSEAFWYRGKVTRRRLIGYGAAAGAIGATMAVPAPWQSAFGQAKPYKIGTMQPLSGVAAAGGKTALVGVQMAVDRINKSGGINGRPVEIVMADDESKPDVARRKVEKLLVEDNVDVHVGGFLSNICLACMPVFEEYKVVNIISVCLDTTLTTTKCNRYSFRPYDYAPSQAVAFAPYLVNKMGKRWYLAYADYSWGQSTRDAYADQIKKAGGEIVGTTGIPLGTADMTPFLSKITGNFDGLFGIFFGKDGGTIGTRAFALGLPGSTNGPATAPSRNLPTCRRSATRSRVLSASTATSRCSMRRSTRRRTRSSSKRPRRDWRRSIPVDRCRIATCSPTTSR